MILQANPMGGVTGGKTELIYKTARLAPGIEVATHLSPYTPQPFAIYSDSTIIRKLDPTANLSSQLQKTGFPSLIHPQSPVRPEWRPATITRMSGLVEKICAIILGMRV